MAGKLLVTMTTLAVSLGAAGPARGQADPEWLRLWEQAQGHRPAELNRVGRLARPDEPGVPLVVHGLVFNPDGTTPAPGVVVFVYQTDRDGIYSGPGKPGDPWRLQGWARTDEEGRFELRTIRPGAYPGRTEPAHIHVVLDSATYGRQWAQPLHFDDDPLVTTQEKRESASRGRFGSVCAVRREDGVAHVEFAARLKPRPDF